MPRLGNIEFRTLNTESECSLCVFCRECGTHAGAKSRSRSRSRSPRTVAGRAGHGEEMAAMTWMTEEHVPDDSGCPSLPSPSCAHEVLVQLQV